MTELIDRTHFTALAALEPNAVIRRTRCSFDAKHNCYTLPVWNSVCAIYPEEARVEWVKGFAPLHDYFGLFAVHYLLSSRDIPPAGIWVSEKDMPGGATFFRGPHAIPTQLIAGKANNSGSIFQELCHRHGGTPLDMADHAAVFSITDRIPVAVLYWAGDDEFPAEAKLLFDKTLTSHFVLDIIFALAVGVAEELGKS